MRWPVDLKLEPGRRRFYLVRESLLRNPSDFDHLNALISDPHSGETNGGIYLIAGGRLRFEGGGELPSFFYGLPDDWHDPPKVKVAVRNKPLDSYGFHRRLVVSSRAKRLLESIDAGAFDFMRCETTSRKGVDVEPYWVMDCARVIPDFVSDRSRFALHPRSTDLAFREVYCPFDIVWDDAIIADRHAFICARIWRYMIWDEMLVDAWRQHKFAGLAFIPLQPPLESERRRQDTFGPLGYQYWSTGAFREFPRGGVTYAAAREIVERARGRSGG